MATKIIYFTVNGRPEQAEFPVDCPAQDVKDLFRAAAEAGPHDILKLLQSLEKKILLEAGETPTIVYEIKNQVELFREKLEMYGLIWLTDLRSKIDNIDLLIMLTSAVCHDLDHTGYNNAYQINARTELALRYNDISPLENHHCAVAFEILEKKESNIFRNLTTEQYKRIREGMIKCILATDMTRHNEILNKFKSILPVFDFTNKDHKDVLMMIMIKVSDISNEARPMDVAEPWLDCLLQEFFNQSDMEKLEGLPVTPFMDRDKVTKPSSQTGFIRFVLFPLFIELANLFPCLEQHIIDPVRKALDYYTEMEKALEKKQNRTQNEKMGKAKEMTQDTAKEPEVQSEQQQTSNQNFSKPGGALKPIVL
ncbi:hypothetical protein JZ751_029417 [Albula glossodonta]|uniref:High affinity cGMP-specific 3',5'-cyclic phosphodiesterase 9A n=1 Tax=Albula glossodonta TaxID=121402 RepID=A0A8T2PJK7_9TELE|nr:hypothetical protein JZ751_029417 [Albula glossodonta]